MSENTALPVKGYTSQSDANVAFVNENKVLEERVLRRLDEMRASTDYDQRMVSLAITKVQEAFMWANRAVFQPDRVPLPADGPEEARRGEAPTGT